MNFQSQGKEITDLNNSLKESIAVIKQKKIDILNRLETLGTSQDNYYKQILSQNELIEKAKERKELILSGTDPTISGANKFPIEELKEKCNKYLDVFIGKPLQIQSNSNLFYTVKYDKNIVTRQLPESEYQMTFAMLRKEICIQFNLNYKETYMTNVNDEILLDNMVVKNVYFPLENISVEDYKPQIIIHDVNDFKDEEESEKKNKNQNEDGENARLTDKTYSQDSHEIHEESLIQKCTDYFKANTYQLVHFFFLIIFIILWITATMELRDIETNIILKKGLEDPINKYFSKQIVRFFLTSASQ